MGIICGHSVKAAKFCGICGFYGICGHSVSVKAAKFCGFCGICGFYGFCGFSDKIQDTGYVCLQEGPNNKCYNVGIDFPLLRSDRPTNNIIFHHSFPNKISINCLYKERKKKLFFFEAVLSWSDLSWLDFGHDLSSSNIGFHEIDSLTSGEFLLRLVCGIMINKLTQCLDKELWTNRKIHDNQSQHNKIKNKIKKKKKEKVELLSIAENGKSRILHSEWSTECRK